MKRQILWAVALLVATFGVSAGNLDRDIFSREDEPGAARQERELRAAGGLDDPGSNIIYPIFSIAPTSVTQTTGWRLFKSSSIEAGWSSRFTADGIRKYTFKTCGSPNSLNPYPTLIWVQQQTGGSFFASSGWDSGCPAGKVGAKVKMVLPAGGYKLIVFGGHPFFTTMNTQVQYNAK